MDTSLKLYFEDSQGTVYNFPYAMQQAELFDFTVNKTRMGSAPTITASLEYPSCLDREWEQWCHFDDIFVVFNNERYYLKATPASSKTNDKLFFKHDLTFVSERAVLETVYMIDDLENQTANILLSNNTQITFFGKIDEFVERINQSMYFSKIGDTCVYDTTTSPPTIIDISLRTPVGDGYYVVVDSSVTNTDEVLITLNNNTILDALKQIFEKYGVPFYFVGKIIHVGDYEEVVETIPTYADSGGVLGAELSSGALVPYEYGQPNSVLQVNRNNGTKQIYNRCSGTGSEDNIPYYYPNPTPSGTIHHQVYEMQGSTLTNSAVTVDSYLKFSNLGASDALVWVQKTQELTEYISSDKEFFFNGRKVQFQVPQPLIPNPQLILQPEPVPQSFTFDFEAGNYNPQTGSYSYRLLPTSAELAVKVFLQKPFYSLDFDFSTECTNDSDWLFVDGGGFIITGGHGRSMQYDYEAQTGYFTLYITKVYIPSNQNWVSGAVLNQIKTVQISIANLVSDAAGWYGSYGENQKFWSLLLSGKQVDIADYGLSIASGIDLVEGDQIKKIVDKWVVPQQKLMPYCYRLSDGKRRFYPARNYPMINVSGNDYEIDSYLGDEVISNTLENDNYKDESNNYYVFANPLRKLKQKEHIYDFPDIKPSIKGMRNASGYGGKRIDMFEEFAYDTNDDNSGYFDENGNWNFNHPYFFALLRPTTDFNLFDQAIDEEKMTIAFTSGDCAPCEFEIAVDKDTQKNLVQIDYNTGNLVRDDDGDVICGRKNDAITAQNYQNLTTTHRVWLALKKDTSTYGENYPMPFNDGTVTIRPKACSDIYSDDGDTFVILHINLPEAYIEAAEQELTREIIKQMNEDNDENFNFSLKYSRVYLGENQPLIDLLTENVKVSTRYNGITKQFFVASYSYRMQASSPIPEITINGLVETVEELKSVASAGIGFMKKISQHISDNFAELMMGANRPFTRIINQNNTNVTNQIRGDFPSNYAIVEDELPKNTLLIGEGGRIVGKVLHGVSGQVLKLIGSMPTWVNDVIELETSGEIHLTQDVSVPNIPTLVQDLTFKSENGGKYFIITQLQFISTQDQGQHVANRKCRAILSTTEGKLSISSGEIEFANKGQINIAAYVELDKDESVEVYAWCDTEKVVTLTDLIDSGFENATLLKAIKIG